MKKTVLFSLIVVIIIFSTSMVSNAFYPADLSEEEFQIILKEREKERENFKKVTATYVAEKEQALQEKKIEAEQILEKYQATPIPLLGVIEPKSTTKTVSQNQSSTPKNQVSLPKKEKRTILKAVLFCGLLFSLAWFAISWTKRYVNK